MPLSPKILVSVLLFTAITICSFAQNEPVPVTVSTEKIIVDGKTFLVHKVKPGETLFSICKAYKITQKDLQAANPELTSGLKSGQVLKIPGDSLPKLPGNLNSDAYIFHIVESGQTVTSISEKYNLPKEILIRQNPEVEISPLQVGQVLKIPKNTAGPAVNEGNMTELTDHKVKKKETLYSISRIYNVSVDEIISANPSLNTSDIQVGQIIKIPAGKPLRVFPNSEPVNPDLKKPGENQGSNELKRDTPLRVRNLQPCEPSADKEIHEVAFLLPFFLDENKTVVELDSLSSAKAVEEKLIFPRSRNFIEFYEGALIALDSLKKAGYSFKIHVYDTGRDPQKLVSILNKEELKHMELFIGPFDTLLLDKALVFAKQHNIKVVSPLSQNSSLLTGNPNLFQVNPTESVKIDGAMQYLATQKNKNIILFRTNRPADKEIYTMFEEKLTLLRPEGFNFRTHTGNKDGVLSSKLSQDKENLIIMPSVEETAVADLLRNLNYVGSKYKISVFGLSRWTTFTNTEIGYLHNLQFEYCTSFFADYTKPTTQRFILKMRNNFRTEPGVQSFSSQGYSYSFLGYDITFYFLSALAKYGRDFDSCLPAHQVDLTQSDFNFYPSNNGDGTMNKVINIVKYNQDFTITRLH